MGCPIWLLIPSLSFPFCSFIEFARGMNVRHNFRQSLWYLLLYPSLNPPSLHPLWQNPLVTPIITPRFAPTCSQALLEGLGGLAKEMDVHIQSHICEQKPEVKFTLELFPDHEHCAAIFERAGLLTDKVRNLAIIFFVCKFLCGAPHIYAGKLLRFLA